MMQSSWSKNIWWNLIGSPFRMVDANKLSYIVKVFLLTLVMAIAQNDAIIIQTLTSFWGITISLFGSSLRHKD
jgi:hypothetical protein